MKVKKLIVLLAVVVFIFFTYFFFKDDKLNYVSLGDSVAAGQNPYGEVGYGYTDYIKDYLNQNKKLKTYADFAVSGYKTSDVINDIDHNREVETEDGKKNIREVLRESDLVTLSIGANDFMNGITITNFDFTKMDQYLKKVDQVIINIDDTLKLIREFAKEEIVVIGYYNPFPILYNSNSRNIDMLFDYADKKYRDVTSKYDIEYLSIYDLFRENSSFLPNPFDIHPNVEGYKNIANLFIETYLK